MTFGAPSACGEVAQPCPFALASAVDGGEEALSYGASIEAGRYGSLAAGRTALSADGRRVVFVTTAVSDLLGPRPPQAPATPALQVAVRDLDTDTTQLVSVRDAGRLGTAAGVRPRKRERQSGRSTRRVRRRRPSDPPKPTEEPPVPSARRSAPTARRSRGWARTSASRRRTLSEENLPAVYAEPLWRRIADGPDAPTQRVTGGSDPLNPACVASGERTLAGHAVARPIPARDRSRGAGKRQLGYVEGRRRRTSCRS